MSFLSRFACSQDFKPPRYLSTCVTCIFPCNFIDSDATFNTKENILQTKPLDRWHPVGGNWIFQRFVHLSVAESSRSGKQNRNSCSYIAQNIAQQHQTTHAVLLVKEATFPPFSSDTLKSRLNYHLMVIFVSLAVKRLMSWPVVCLCHKQTTLLSAQRAAVAPCFLAESSTSGTR